jgi:hypothetical protein
VKENAAIMYAAQLVNRRPDCEESKMKISGRKVWLSGTLYSKLTEDQQQNGAQGVMHHHLFPIA